MRVLWISNIQLLSKKNDKSGTWIHSMYRELHNHDEVEIVGNITVANATKRIEKKESMNFTEYLLPKAFINSQGLPKPSARLKLLDLIKSFNADIVHVWGIEQFWGSLIPIEGGGHLVEIQGIKSVCSRGVYFDGGLSTDILKRKGLYELIFRRSTHQSIKREFNKWEKTENEILQRARYINTQSDWVRNVISTKVPISTKIFNTGIILREEFTESPTWGAIHKANQDPVIFALSAPRVYKGIHTALEAFVLVRKYFPKAKFRIAGIGLPKRKWLTSSYIRYLLSFIKDNKIDDSVEFIGNLEASRIVEEMYGADVYVNASFIETYCLSLAEAMAIGMPCVASYTSALPELIMPGIDGLLFPMGDSFECAKQIIRILSNREESLRYSANASRKLREKSDRKRIGQNQVEIYKEIIKRSIISTSPP